MKKIFINSSLIFLIFSCNSISKNKNISLVDNNRIKQLNNVNNKWLGEWSYTKMFSGASCEISNTNIDSIEFSLSASDGAHSGEISGKANLHNNLARFINPENEDTCEIEFEFKEDSIIINQKKGTCGAGMGVSYDGIYYNSKLASAKSDTNKTLVDLKILKDKKEDEVFKKLVGKDYGLFLQSSQLTSEDSDLDNFGAVVRSSAVHGLFTLDENIIMVNDKLQIWAAVIDDSCVNYYTNDDKYKNKLPKTIENWRTNFSENKIIYKSQEQ